MEAISIYESALCREILKPAREYVVDLSHASLLECCETYIAFMKKKSPNFSFPVINHIRDLVEKAHSNFMPCQVTDFFWVAFINWLEVEKDVKPNTAEQYCSKLRACLAFASRHNAVVDPEYDQFDVEPYEPTRVVLTMHQLHTLYDFKFESVTHEVTKKQRVYTYENVLRTTRTHSKKNKVCYRYRSYVRDGKLVREKIKSSYVRVTCVKKQVIKKRSVAKYVEVKVIAPVLRPDTIRTFDAVRDMFCLSCCLYQRHSDMVRINPDCFNKDKSSFSTCQQKTGSKAVVDIKRDAMDYKIAKAILEKYDYHCPYKRSLGVYNKHLHSMFEFIGGEFLENVKVEYKRLGEIVTELVPMYKKLSSHAGRRTAITNSAVTKKVPLLDVMRNSGHRDYRSAQKYLVYGEE